MEQRAPMTVMAFEDRVLLSMNADGVTIMMHLSFKQAKDIAAELAAATPTTPEAKGE